MYITIIAILAVLGLALLVPLGMIGLSAVLGPRDPSPTKSMPYEGGLPRIVGSARERFSIKFYLIAILFILFDVETAFMYPWAVDFRHLGGFGFVEMAVFIGILLLGYLYIVRKGALKWD